MGRIDNVSPLLPSNLRHIGRFFAERGSLAFVLNYIKSMYENIKKDRIKKERGNKRFRLSYE